MYYKPRVFGIPFITLLFLFSPFFALFKLAGWPTRAIIARGSQWVPKDIVAISLSLSLAIVAVDTAQNEPLKLLRRFHLFNRLLSSC